MGRVVPAGFALGSSECRERSALALHFHLNDCFSEGFGQLRPLLDLCHIKGAYPPASEVTPAGRGRAGAWECCSRGPPAGLSPALPDLEACGAVLS